MTSLRIPSNSPLEVILPFLHQEEKPTTHTHTPPPRLDSRQLVPVLTKRDTMKVMPWGI